MTKSVIHIDDASFEREVMESPEPVLVDFWAPRCAPCLTIGPIIEELAVEYQGRLKVAKINADESPLSAARCGVRGIPTLLLIVAGQVKRQILGAVAKRRLSQAIEDVLAG